MPVIDPDNELNIETVPDGLSADAIVRPIEEWMLR